MRHGDEKFKVCWHVKYHNGHADLFQGLGADNDEDDDDFSRFRKARSGGYHTRWANYVKGLNND